MAKQTVTRTVTRSRVRKGTMPKGTHPCPQCGGRGWKYNTGRGSKKRG